jgi:hypothetical protein
MDQHKTLDQLQASWSFFDRPKDGEEYVHYKGGHYQIVATGFLEASEVPCVIYKSLKNKSIWVRTAENFLETIEYNGQAVPRFSKIEAI